MVLFSLASFVLPRYVGLSCPRRQRLGVGYTLPIPKFSIPSTNSQLSTVTCQLAP